ncbi:MAG: hypothetical protein FJX64_10375, partial [Alphaproteobacteria bacterium]|nr:hypothetical protein [Alphaproteobacteria bacterium]
MQEDKHTPISPRVLIASLVVGVATIAGTVVYMERGRLETTNDPIAALPNRGEPRPLPAAPAPDAPRVAVAGAAAMQVTAPGAPAPAPAVEFRPDENQRRAYAAMNALGQQNPAVAPPAPAPQAGTVQPAPYDPVAGYTLTPAVPAVAPAQQAAAAPAPVPAPAP